MTGQKAIYILMWVFFLHVIGFWIYFICRTPIIAFTRLHITTTECMICNIHNPFVYFLVYCLPDALWYLSLLLMQTFFLEETGRLNRLLVGIAISLPFLLETGQYIGVVPGTFDWFDITTYFFTLILFLCLRKTSLLSPYKSS